MKKARKVLANHVKSAVASMMKICTDSTAMLGHANAELQGNKSDWIVKLVDSQYPQLDKNVPPKFQMLFGDHVTKVKY